MIFWYELVDPHLVVEAVTKEMIDKIKAETKLPLFHGFAP